MSVCEKEFVDYYFNDSLPSPTNISMVVSFCNAHKSMMSALKVFPDCTSYVISKCGLTVPETNLSLPNVGRVDFSYLTYIITHYNNLSDTTLFIKDSWLRQNNDMFFHIPRVTLQDMIIQNNGFKCLFRYRNRHI